MHKLIEVSTQEKMQHLEVFWSTTITADTPFSFDNIPEGCILHITSATLDVDVDSEAQEQQPIEEESSGVSMPKHVQEYLKARQDMESRYNKTLFDVKPHGVALQVCIFDTEIKKRRKFLLGTFSTKVCTVSKRTNLMLTLQSDDDRNET